MVGPPSRIIAKVFIRPLVGALASLPTMSVPPKYTCSASLVERAGCGFAGSGGATGCCRSISLGADGSRSDRLVCSMRAFSLGSMCNPCSHRWRRHDSSTPRCSVVPATRNW
ncbi:hypothetical protein D3C75_1179000 [compost metagenome]